MARQISAKENPSTSKFSSAPAISGGNNSESEIQHISIRDRAVSYEDILSMANEILGSSSTKFSIEFCDCELTADHLKCLCDKIKGAHFQITTLAISYMDSIDELIENTCFIVWKYETKSLSLEYDELNDKSLELFQLYFDDKKMSTAKLQIENLDISYNYSIGEAGFELIGKIMKKFNIVSLKATDCNITDEKLKRLLDALYGVKLKKLDISCNEQLTNEGFKILAKFVSNKSVGRLELSGFKLSNENLDAFREVLPQTGHESLLEDLDVSYNSTIEPNSSVGSVVVNCGVTKLSMAGCKLSKDHLICLRESMKNHKMDLINLRDNASIGQDIERIADLVKQSEVKELNISDCMFSAQKLELFRKSLDGAQINILHLGDQRREPDNKYVDELCILMANVKDVLYLRFHKLNDDFCTVLQERCKNHAKIILTVGGKEQILCGKKSSEVETGVRIRKKRARPEMLKIEDNARCEESSEEHSPTSLKTKKFKCQNLEPVIESTEEMLKEYSATLENMSSLTEDIGVVFKNEISRIFKCNDDFLEFAQSEKGLNLDKSDVQCILRGDRTFVDENGVIAILELWKEKNESTATPFTIREIVKRYYGIEEKDVLNLCDGKVRAFTSHQLRGGAFLGEILSSTGYRFCAIRLFDSNDTQVLDAAKTLLDAEHDNVISVLDAGTYRDKQFKELIYAATELTSSKSLEDYFDLRPLGKVSFNEQTALNLAQQMLLAIDFMQSRNITCRNLKPHDFFVSHDKKQLKLQPLQSIKRSFDAKDIYPGPYIFTAGIVMAQIFSVFSENVFGYYGYDTEHIQSLQNLDLSNLSVDNKKKWEEIILHMFDSYPENSPTAIQILSDITFFQYPFKATEDVTDVNAKIENNRAIVTGKYPLKQKFSVQVEENSIVIEKQFVSAKEFEWPCRPSNKYDFVVNVVDAGDNDGVKSNSVCTRDETFKETTIQEPSASKDKKSPNSPKTKEEKFTASTTGDKAYNETTTREQPTTSSKDEKSSNFQPTSSSSIPTSSRTKQEKFPAPTKTGNPMHVSSIAIYANVINVNSAIGELNIESSNLATGGTHNTTNKEVAKDFEGKLGEKNGIQEDDRGFFRHLPFTRNSRWRDFGFHTCTIVMAVLIIRLMRHFWSSHHFSG